MGGPEAWLPEWEASDRSAVAAAVLTLVSVDLLRHVAGERGQDPRDVLEQIRADWTEDFGFRGRLDG